MRLGMSDSVRNITLLVLAVLILTLVTIGVSYSAFFTVGNQGTLQTIKAGSLDVSIDKSSTTINGELYPTEEKYLPTSAVTTNEVLTKSAYSNVLLVNSGSLDADFSVSVTYDDLPEGKSSDDVIPLEYLKIGIYDVINNEWINFGNSSYYLNLSDLTPSEPNVYPIVRSELAAQTSLQVRIYVWLSEDVPISKIDKLVYLKLNVKSIVLEK